MWAFTKPDVCGTMSMKYPLVDSSARILNNAEWMDYAHTKTSPHIDCNPQPCIDPDSDGTFGLMS